MLLRAYAAALRDVPDLLCRWEDDRATEAGPPAIALAVATDRGLLVPTFVEPDLGDAARARRRDARRGPRRPTRASSTARYLGLANGSLSNLGGLGVDRFQALLTPPQASVLSPRVDPAASGRRAGRRRARADRQAGLTVDHRVADGAHAAQLLRPSPRGSARARP